MLRSEICSARWTWPLFGLALAVLVAGCSGGAKPAPAPAPKTGDKSGAPAAKSATEPAKATGPAKRIIILTNGNSPFWDACRAGMLDAEKELGLKAAGFQAVLEVNDNTIPGQLEKLRQFGTQSDIVAVGVSALHSNNVAVADEMRNLKQKGIKVVTIDSDVDPSLHDTRLGYLGSNNVAAGQTLGLCLKTLLPEGGGYVTFVGETSAQNAIERIGGFAEGAGEKLQSLDSMGDSNEPTRARENVRNAMRNHADKLKALVGIWSYNAPAIVDVLKESNSRSKYSIVVFDAEPLAIVAMTDGLIDAMLVQNPYQMGYQGVRALKAFVEDDQKTLKDIYPKFGEKGGDIYDTGLKVVVPNDSTKLDGVKFPPKIEFMKLAPFKEWLNKYNLEGS